MCNFYVMYWVDSEENLMHNKFCFNKETPFENWLSNLNASLLQTMPKNVSVLPGTNTVFKEKYWMGNEVEEGMHKNLEETYGKMGEMHERMEELHHKKSGDVANQKIQSYDYEELKRMLSSRDVLQKSGNLDYIDAHKDVPYWRLKGVVEDGGDAGWKDREGFLDYTDYPSERFFSDYPDDRRTYETRRMYRDEIRNEKQKRYYPYEFFATEGMKKRKISY